MTSCKYLKINGGSPLRGSVRVQGSKNAALPVMAASLLLAKGASLTCANVPHLKDIETLVTLLRSVGMEIHSDEEKIVVLKKGELNPEMPEAEVRKMRASSILLGPLLAARGRAVMSLPGGCAIGARPIDLHMKGLEKMGASIELSHGTVYASAKRLHGADIYLDFPSVGATENLVMAAALAEGETTIENVAREPEILNLVQALKTMGADVDFKADNNAIIAVKGKPELVSGSVQVIPDRIAACTYLLGGVMTNGEVTVTSVEPHHFSSVLAKLEESDITYDKNADSVTVYPSRSKLRGVSLQTMPYPGFPTDVQPQMMAALCLAKGTSVIKEVIFESRMLHVPELRKMGAFIEAHGNTAIINGVPSLNGTSVKATDLRAGAALTLAALAAEGESKVRGLDYILRGYENFDDVLNSLGAKVSVEEDDEDESD